MNCTQLNDIIKSSKNILIISHLNPDGDTLGSMCGLYSAIQDNYKKHAEMLLMSKVPENYKFLPNISEAKHVSEFDKSREYDLVINVDVASKDRMFESEILFNKAKHTVNIDHHITNENYAEINFVLPNSSSAGEVLFGIMKSLGWKISLATAKCIYTAILTDTGSFTYSNTTAGALSIASELVNIGVLPVEIYKNCYESASKEQIQFQAYCMSKAAFSCEDKAAYIIVYRKDMEKFNVSEDCTDGLSESLRAIKSVKISFIVKQLSSSLSKISMRSEEADVAAICSKFGGGGHKLAAGALVKANVKDTAKKVLEEIDKLEL